MIHLIIEGNIAILSFETQKGNSFNLNDIYDLQNLLKSVELNESIKGIILTGCGSSFSTGGNVDYINSLSTNEEIAHFFHCIDETLLNIFSLKKPVCSAINGHAIGFGFLVMLASDFFVVTDSRRFKYGLPEIKIGMTLDSLMFKILEFNGMSGEKLAKIIYKGTLLDICSLTKLFSPDKITNQDSIISDSLDILHNYTDNTLKPFMMNKMSIKSSYIFSMKKSIQNMDYKIFLECLNINKND